MSHGLLRGDITVKKKKKNSPFFGYHVENKIKLGTCGAGANGVNDRYSLWKTVPLTWA